MEDTKWARWLKAITHEDTERGVARAVGVSHSTVQRWAAKGISAEKVWELTLRFKGDPIAALVVLGGVAPDQVRQLNFAAVLRYVDADLLTAELHSRAMRERAKSQRSDAFDGTPYPIDGEGWGGPLGRSDALSRQSFRLTAR